MKARTLTGVLGMVLSTALVFISPVFAHDSHHGGGYSEREGSRRYAPQYEDDRWEDEDEEDEAYRSSSRRYPPPNGNALLPASGGTGHSGKRLNLPFPV